MRKFTPLPAVAAIVAAVIVAQQPCSTNAQYSGPLRRQVPAEVWQRDFTRGIDGSLPAAVISALQEVVNEFTDRAPAASVAVAIPGVGRWAVSQGVARTEPKTLLPPHASFQVASTTKTFTAVTILQLEAEGRLLISQTIESWFHDVPNAGITTFDHLLRHTSGLVSFNALPSWTLDYRQPRDVIAMVAARSPQFCPGSNFAYSNTGYAILGVTIEDLEKRQLAEVFRERIARPLGLKHTALRYPDDDMPVVSGHVGGKPVDVPDHYATPFAAGGLASTAEDLVTFWHAFLGGQLVLSETVRAMFTDLAPMDESGRMFYGRGVQLYDIPQGPGLMLGHSGGITGFTSIVVYLVDDDMFVAVVFNDQETPAEAGLWAVVRAVRRSRPGVSGLGR
jgi:D-alanyl-D-alanine carboxypeptidase